MVDEYGMIRFEYIRPENQKGELRQKVLDGRQ